MERNISIGGADYRMRASALIPRLYRAKFGRDLIRDMNQLEQAYRKAASLSPDASDEEKKEAQLSALDLKIFENIAWTMCKAAQGNEIPEDPDEWLNGIDGVFSIYEAMPQILDLWQTGLATTSTAVKK